MQPEACNGHREEGHKHCKIRSHMPDYHVLTIHVRPDVPGLGVDRENALEAGTEAWQRWTMAATKKLVVL